MFFFFFFFEANHIFGLLRICIFEPVNN